MAQGGRSPSRDPKPARKSLGAFSELFQDFRPARAQATPTGPRRLRREVDQIKDVLMTENPLAAGAKRAYGCGATVE